MKIEFSFSPMVDVTVDEKVTGGKAPRSLLLEPFFPSPKASCDVLYGIVRADDGRTLDRFAIAVSGATGKVCKRSFAVEGKSEIEGGKVSLALAVEPPEERPPISPEGEE